MKDLLLSLDNDLSLNLKGDIEITTSLLQAIKIRLNWFLGEWKFGTNYGLPYYEDILIKNPNENKIRHIFEEAILEVEGILEASITYFKLSPEEKLLRLNFKALERSGQILSNSLALSL